ncbi:hypothetical protein [Scopulibacillus darangshiensis]|nr:hypothetical protein [Scopulibacillus darangshiensis]
MRSNIDYYPFTKKQVLAAADPHYIDKTPAMNQLLQFLLEHYELTSEETDEIASQFINMINSNAEPALMVQYLQSIIEFPSFEAAGQIIDRVMTLHNNTRMWILKGHTPQSPGAL